ncbi:hypothetical protein BVY03_03280 [bacterium K02(2017)]|nr:hypothetical protein BVY03_03280 [bacterium K02(2017)]
MIYKSLKILTSLFICASFIVSCGSGTSPGQFISPSHVVVDSTNDRVFVTESPQQLVALVASTLEDIGDQPIVNEANDATTFALLPRVVSNFALFQTGAISRLFIMGAFVDANGNRVLNRIRVLDFDGTTFTQPSFSPIDLSDGDNSTLDTDNSYADMLVDQANSRLYITDATTGLLYVLNPADGTTLNAPIAIAGTPQQMSLDNGRLYICNSTSTVANQLVTVVNSSDFTTTTIDVGAPCRLIAAKSNTNGTVLLVKRSDSQTILILSVNTTTFASATPINTATAGFLNGSLSAGTGITSSIGGISLSRSTSGIVYGYLSELDGNIQYLTFGTNIDTYTIETLSTSATDITNSDVLTDTSGNASMAFIVGETGTLINIDVGTTSVTVNN